MSRHSDDAIGEQVERIPRGEVRVFLCADVPACLSALEQVASSQESLRMVAYAWDHLPDLNTLLQLTVRLLARIAYELWPHWYAMGSVFENVEGSSTQQIVEGLRAVHEAVKARKGISIQWLTEAVDYRREGRLPLPEGFSPSIQALQLAMIIDPRGLLSTLALKDPRQEGDKLLGFARVAEWLAMETQARVAVLIPEELSNRTELDCILYDSTAFPEVCEARIPPGEEEEQEAIVWPVQGKPHPFSPGEKRLAQWLSRDPQLAGLFQFNQPVTTTRGTRFMVDLLWRAGGIVVEVDGYSHHGNRYAFRSDRARDYELIITGLLVLRLTHDEVVTDTRVALEKIRDVVAFRRTALDTHSKE